MTIDRWTWSPVPLASLFADVRVIPRVFVTETLSEPGYGKSSTHNLHPVALRQSSGSGGESCCTDYWAGGPKSHVPQELAAPLQVLGLRLVEPGATDDTIVDHPRFLARSGVPLKKFHLEPRRPRQRVGAWCLFPGRSDIA